MAATRVLFFDGNQIAVWRWQAGNSLAEDRFDATPVGLEAFAEHLKSEPHQPVVMLTDIAEEGFQLENIPRLQGGDRTALIARRLSQYFYGTPYATAISLGREATGRKDERVMFSALSRPEMLAPWIDQLRTARIPLRGIYSVPLIIASQKYSFATEPRFVVVTMTRGGLRHTFFDRAQMNFSRLSQINSTRIDSIAAVCHRETGKTVQYLLGQRQITRGTRLPIYVLAHPDEHRSLAAQCINNGDIAYEFINLADFAKHCGFKGTITDSFAEPILAHCLATKPPQNQFAPDAERHVFKLWQMRQGLRALGAALLLGGLIWAGKQFIDVQTLDEETSSLRAKVASDEQKYQRILSSLPVVSISPTDLRTLLNSVDELTLRSPTITPLLAHLGQVLVDFPGVELSQLAWRVAKVPEGMLAAGSGNASASAGSSQPLTNPQSDAVAWTVLDLTASLPIGLTSDQRAQVELVDQLVKRLEHNGVLVKVLIMPVDIQSDKQIKSESRATSGQTPALKCSLRLAMPISKPEAKQP